MGALANCCKKEVEPIEALLAQYWEGVKTSYSNVFAKIYRGEVFGKDCRYYDMLADLNYLSVLLTLMYYDIVRDRENKDCADWTPISTFYVKYKIDCIIAKFRCAGLNIQPLIIIFIPLPNSLQGIGSMEIEGDDSCSSPSFIVS